MANDSWKNPWKLTAVGMALMIAAGLLTGLVVANWSGGKSDRTVVADSAGSATTRRAAATTAVGVPTQSAIVGCNQTAATQAGEREKIKDTVIAGAIGAAAGAAVGAAGGAVIDGGSGAGKGAIIGGLVGAGGGTLYGLNENRRYDDTYRNAYAVCMRSHGYTA